MDHKEIVYKACSDLYEKYRSPESENIMEIVKERAGADVDAGRLHLRAA